MRFSRLRDAFWIACLLVAPAGLLLHAGQAFPGFFPGYVGQIELTDRPGWTGPRAGLKPFDRVVAVNGRPRSSILAYVAQSPPGTVFRYTLQDGRTLPIRSLPLSAEEIAWQVLPLWISVALHLGLGRWVQRRRPRSEPARAHARFCEAMAAFFLGCLLGEAWQGFNLLTCFVTALLPLPVAGLALAFPQPLERWRGPVTWVARVMAAVGVVAIAAGALVPAWYVTAEQLVVASASAAVLALLGLWAVQMVLPSLPPDRRAQVRVVWLGLGVSLLPSMASAALVTVWPALSTVDFSSVTLCAFPIAVAYAILRHRWLDLPRLVTRGTVAALLVALLGSLYVGLAAAVQGVLPRGPSVAGFVAALGVAAAYRPLHGWLLGVVERVLGTGRPDPLALLARLGEEQVPRVEVLAEQLAGLAREITQARWARVAQGRELLAAAGPAEAPGGLEKEAVLVVGIRPQDLPEARLELGAREDEVPYQEHERRLLEVLALHTARGFERAALVEARAVADGLAEERAALLRQIVHDLGTDLTNLAVAAELARENPVAERPWRSIARSLERIEQFLQEKRRRLAEPARRASGSARGGRDRAIAALAPTLDRRGQSLDVCWGAERDLIPLSEVEFEQVLRNLLDNASKASPPGAALGLAARDDGGWLEVTVRDRGQGFPPVLLNGGATPGPGLGLHNVRALLAAAGGSRTLANEAGGGVVTLRLPAAAGQDRAGAAVDA